MQCYQHGYASYYYGNAYGEEEHEEPLGIMTEVTAIVFFVAVHGFLTFFF